MSDLPVLYYSLCYTVGGIGLVLSLVQALARLGAAGNRGWKGLRARMGSSAFLYACVQVSLALMLVTFFTITYDQRVGGRGLWSIGLWISNVAGEALLAFALPRLVLSAIPNRHERTVRTVSAISAAAILASFPLNFIFTETVFFVFVPMAILPAAILYAILAFLLRDRTESGRAAESSDPDRAFWLSYLAAMTRISLVSLPILIAFDFFPLLGAWAMGALGLEYDIRFKSFPLLYLAFSAVYAARIIPRIAGREAREAAPCGVPRSDAPLPDVRAGLEGLSERELEVARLLVSGRKYSDIGDRLFISLSTVKTHVERIYRKTGARSKIELANVLRAWPRAEADAEGRAPAD